MMRNFPKRTLVGFSCLKLAALLLLTQVSMAEDKLESSPDKILKTFVNEFIKITPGVEQFPKTFEMGSATGLASERPVRKVTLDHSFSISKYEIYQELYLEVMGTNPSRWPGPRNSAERMTHAEAVEFCQRLTKRLQAMNLITEKQLIRLPTEVEWEYCVRAGTKSPYSFGEKAQKQGDVGKQASLLDEYCWHTGNAAGNDPAVGVLKPNPWGLYDVHGYLAEYCLEDWRSDYSTDAKTDQTKVVIRGGSWKDAYPLQTSSTRRPFSKDGRDDALGFRCVLAEQKEAP